VRETKRKFSSVIETPLYNAREEQNHRGTVLAVGAGAFTRTGVPVACEAKIGDEVFFHFEFTEKGRTAPWIDGEPAVWLLQREVDAVIE
jgi:co-chaperonin GroES (HSP10)